MTIRRVVLMCVLALGCASAPRARPEATAPGRTKDSAAERVAAYRAASGGLRLEQEEERWGIEAARERRRGRGTPPPPAHSLPPETPPAAAGPTHQIHLAAPR
jgi:hypothetical protein